MKFIKKIIMSIVSLQIMCSQCLNNISAYDYYICKTSDIFTCSNCHESAPAMPGYTGAIKHYFKIISNGNRICIGCFMKDFDEQFKSYVKGLVPQYNVNALQNLKNNNFYNNCPLPFFMGFIDPTEEKNLTNNFECCICYHEFSRRSSEYWQCEAGNHYVCSACKKDPKLGSKYKDPLNECPVCQNDDNPMQKISFTTFKNSVDQKIDKIIEDGAEVY